MNVRTGTAALVSKAYPGSFHDIRILREHADQMNELLGERKMLADLGYVGAHRDVRGIVVCDENDRTLRGRRVFVECFFGRLKGKWRIFSEKWILEEKYFDRFFDLACALTNLHIFHYPLVLADQQFNDGVLNMILIRIQMKAARQRLANEEYAIRRRRRLQADSDETEETIEM